MAATGLECDTPLARLAGIAVELSSQMTTNAMPVAIATATTTATTAMSHFIPLLRGGGADGPVPGGK